MANTIRHKRGTTTPAASALVTGEIAINTATGTAFTKTDAGTVVALGGLSLADLGNGNATAGALVLDALENSNAPSATNPFATEGDLNSAVTSFSAQIGACKAWVNFNGTGTVAIRAALNVSSITDNGTGDYTVNFTTAMPDTNYSCVATCSPVYASSGPAWPVINGSVAAWSTENAPTTSSIRVGAASPSTYWDVKYMSVAIFR